MDLATILISSLSPDTAQRSAAEKELERLQPDAQFALALTDLIANLDNPLHTRQISVQLDCYYPC